MKVTPFRIHIDDAAIADLRERLSRTRWPEQTVVADWGNGADPAYLRAFVRYWLDEFDWRAQEARLNALPQYCAEIDGYSIHFVHARGQGPAPLPLIVTHGWPGSFVEMEKLVPLLADPARHGADARDAFDVIVPSVPGFGFSTRPRERGMHARRIAQLWTALMRGLGYNRYGAHGGDIGAAISTWLAVDDPAVAGIHLNYIPGAFNPDPGSEPLHAEEAAFLEERQQWFQSEGAYAHLQSTRPLTAAHALNDSPAGLAAWLVEKYRAWSDCGGDVERRFSKDDMLCNIALYWFTGTIGSSMQYYFEGREYPASFHGVPPPGVPCAIARLPREIPMPPRRFVERFYRVVRWTEFARGGHFAAMEEPEALAQDIRAFFRELRDDHT